MLLINGMPVIHIELKKSNVSIKQAENQIEKYAYEGLFTGLFSLIQIFVAMNPEETVYFANPGPDGKFNPNFYFHWTDFNNEPINDWKRIASTLLSIPMAHQLIGFYTVADNTDEVLKVMRSYQYYASNAISDKVSKTDWSSPKIETKGGYIWHTTGSGKTMTSFKSAQLIASSKDADKVIFLMDRVELGTQSLRDYRGFANEDEEIQSTENTNILLTKLKSNDIRDTLIVTSIQKMSRIQEENGINEIDIEKINKKRIVIIIDECHRDTFGEMLYNIRITFPRAILFGFTGTPILSDNHKKDSETSDVFGDELHRYSIADGIRDKNVLGFDKCKVLTYKDKDLRKAVALDVLKCQTEEEAINDENKKEKYYEFMQSKKMFGYETDSGNYIKGIEDYISSSQYETKEHQNAVVDNILGGWTTRSHDKKFHAIFATSSIKEAVEYYRLFKEKESKLKITVLVDPNIDNTDNFAFKEDGLKEILEDYNEMFEVKYSLSEAYKFKQDLSLRLAHKKPYNNLSKDKQIDLLIVVDQMLTGFDSKWINTLYLDKILRYENIIQAFSRTNRLFGPDKPFGIVVWYRKPHTMEKYIEKAVQLYSGNRPFGLFVEKLDYNIKNMKLVYDEIKTIFEKDGIKNFEKLPKDIESRKKFISLFNDFNKYYEAAKVQGFKFSEEVNIDYQFMSIYDDTDRKEILKEISNKDFITTEKYNALVQRYKEMSKQNDEGKGGERNSFAYDIETYITEIDTEKIDSEYMNSNFKKYLKALEQENISTEELNILLEGLHKSFASLSQEKQKYANIFLNDIQRGEVVIKQGKTFMDYITEYETKAENDQIKKIASFFGLDANKLRALVNSDVTEDNINKFGRFDELISTVDKEMAKKFFKERFNQDYDDFTLNMQIYSCLSKFLLAKSNDFDFEN